MQIIDDVLIKLESIIDWSKANDSAIGYFAVLYHHMTAAVQQGIQNGAFEDGPRMEKLDVLFAKRYIEAYDLFIQNKPVTKAWQIAFEQAQTNKITILQHLILGVNAHINLDLAIAAAQTSPGSAIFGLKNDFEKINTIIAQLTGQIQQKLGVVSPSFGLVDSLLKTKDEGFINFSINIARSVSWANAVDLAQTNNRAMKISKMDQNTKTLANRTLRPGPIISAALRLVKLTETLPVAESIRLLKF